MIATDEDALICDLAETYQIYNYRSLPASLVATFSAGLRENSRIKMKMRGDRAPWNSVLLAMMHDRMTDILYMLGAYEESSRPEYISKTLLETRDQAKVRGYSSPEEFHEARRKLAGG